jgi:hypothetical protein
MTKQERWRKRTRPVEPGSLLDKRFEPFIESSKRLLTKIHPLIVLADLRRGSLASLDKYIAQEGGIPDRHVAIELRKLISGSAQRSPFRLEIVEHPDGPKNTGGRPASDRHGCMERDRIIAARHEQVLAEVQKAWLATEQVAAEFALSPSTVRRAIRSVRDANNREKCALETKGRRDSALAGLRKRTGTHSD